MNNYEKHGRAWAIFGMISNLFCVGVIVFLILKFNAWEKVNLTPEVRLIYGQKLDKILYYMILPSIALVMAGSSLLFWNLRK